MVKCIAYAGVIALLFMASVALGTSTDDYITAFSINPNSGQRATPPVGQNTFNLGYMFSVATPIQVMRLGIFDGQDGGGLKSNRAPYQVGIWSVQETSLAGTSFHAGPLVAFATVTSDGDLVGGFKYANAYGNLAETAASASPVLGAGLYFAACEATDNPFIINATDFEPHDGISLPLFHRQTGGAAYDYNCFSYWSAPGDLQTPPTFTPFAPPNQDPDTQISNGYWGPNFQFVPSPLAETLIPEPVTMASLGLGLVGLGGYLRRRRALGGLPTT